MINSEGVSFVQRAYSEEIRELVSSNPGLLKETLFLINELRATDVLNEEKVSSDGKKKVILLGYHNDEDRRYYRASCVDDLGIPHDFFVKEINHPGEDSEDGVREFKESDTLDSKLQEYGEDKVRVVKGVLGISMNNKSYFVSEYEENMIRGFDLDDLLEADKGLRLRVRNLRNFLVSQGYGDIQMGYSPDTNEILVFDVTN